MKSRSILIVTLVLVIGFVLGYLVRSYIVRDYIGDMVDGHAEASKQASFTEMELRSLKYDFAELNRNYDLVVDCVQDYAWNFDRTKDGFRYTIDDILEIENCF